MTWVDTEWSLSEICDSLITKILYIELDFRSLVCQDNWG